MISLDGKYGHADVMIDDVETDCISQIMGFLNHPLYTNSVKIMPDTHGGKGSVIGFTMKLTGLGICPNVIGVDIGCGMNCWQLEDGQTINFEELDDVIRRNVPLGPRTHEKAIEHMETDFLWRDATLELALFAKAYNSEFGTDYTAPTIDYDRYVGICELLKNPQYKVDKTLEQVDRAIGTLGGGNHFIELGLGDDGLHYLTVHTGSRNFGKRIADYYQKLAQGQEHNKAYDKDLAYLTGDEAMDYFMAMIIAQKYASMNREVIGAIIAETSNLSFDPGTYIESIHNFINFEDLIIRKGAISSYVGNKMIIPFNMADGMWICEGKSNPDWNNSAPHGAGRLMSRGQAKRTLNMDDFCKQMKCAGVFSTSVCPETLDEAPESYKPPKVIQDAIGPTATIITRVKPVFNLKSTEDTGFRKKYDKRDPNNEPDAIWSRVKKTFRRGVITDENEMQMRQDFEKDPRLFCKVYR